MDPSIAQPIAIISSLSGLNGEVRLKPLSRYFEDHIMSKYFMVGHSKSNLKKYNLLPKKYGYYKSNISRKRFN